MTEIDPSKLRCAVVGRGRLGTALAAALRDAGVAVDGPLGRGTDPAAPLGDTAVASPPAGAPLGRDAAPATAAPDVVLLAVPDAEIGAAAAAVGPGPIVGHCSGATTLAPLGEREALSLHPLMTVTTQGATFAGATAAVAGSTPRALAAATTLARALGMRPVEVADADRAAYHAAAAIASNFLVTLEAAAERLAATTGLDRTALVPLVRATVDNWAAVGGERALTGPIARGDEVTVRRHRAAIEERTPELTALYDALADATRALATHAAGSPATDDATRVPAATPGPAAPASEAAA